MTFAAPTAFLRLSLSAFSALALLAQAGCTLLPPARPDQTRYYVLAEPAAAATAAEKAAPERTLRVGLARVQLAPYLGGRSLVVRRGANEIVNQDFARWAEPLDVAIGRTVGDRLADSGRVIRVYAQPYPFDIERDYDVFLRVLHCEGAERGGATTARFVCEISIVDAREDGGAVRVRKVFAPAEAEWNGRDFGRLALLLGAAVDELAAEVVASLPAPAEGTSAP